MTPKLTDHDLLLEIKTHVEYIRADIKKACEERENLDKRVTNVEGKMKLWVAGATAIGGIIIFTIDKVIDFFTRKL